MCVFSCGVVAFVILVKWLALVKTEKFTCRGVKRCGIEAFVILVKLLALMKIEKFTCRGVKRCGIVAFVILVKWLALVKTKKITCRGVKTLWNCGARDFIQKFNQAYDDSIKSSMCVYSCGVVAFVILVKWLALVKNEKLTCSGVKTLWNWGVRDLREIASSHENWKIHL